MDFNLNSGVREDFAKHIKDQVQRDSDYQKVEDVVLNKNYTDDFAPVFEDLSGFKRRDYQEDALRLIWCLSIEASFTFLIIQMLVGTGKSLMQSYFGLALTRFDTSNKVLILHSSKEVAQHSFNKYAIKDIFSVAMPSDF